MGFGRKKTGVMNVVVVFMIRLAEGEREDGSSSESSAVGSLDVGSSVGDGGSERVVGGGVAMDIFGLSRYGSLRNVAISR